MESIFFTQLTVPEVKKLFRDELMQFFAEKQEARNSQLKSNSGDLLNVEQAAKFLSLAVPTIYSMVSQKKLPFLKRSKRLYFLKEDLIGWAKEGRQKTLSEIEEGANELITK